LVAAILTLSELPKVSLKFLQKCVKIGSNGCIFPKWGNQARAEPVRRVPRRQLEQPSGDIVWVAWDIQMNLIHKASDFILAPSIVRKTNRGGDEGGPLDASGGRLEVELTALGDSCLLHGAIYLVGVLERERSLCIF